MTTEEKEEKKRVKEKFANPPHMAFKVSSHFPVVSKNAMNSARNYAIPWFTTFATQKPSYDIDQKKDDWEGDTTHNNKKAGIFN